MNDIDDGGPADEMSLRDYFAVRAPTVPLELLQQCHRECPNVDHSDVIASWNYTYADAMLRARKVPA